jgi:hypothetical protein
MGSVQVGEHAGVGQVQRGHGTAQGGVQLFGQRRGPRGDRQDRPIRQIHARQVADHAVQVRLRAAFDQGQALQVRQHAAVAADAARVGVVDVLAHMGQ